MAGPQGAIDAEFQVVSGPYRPGDQHPSRRGWYFTGRYDADGSALWHNPTWWRWLLRNARGLAVLAYWTVGLIFLSYLAVHAALRFKRPANLAPQPSPFLADYPAPPPLTIDGQPTADFLLAKIRRGEPLYWRYHQWARVLGLIEPDYPVAADDPLTRLERQAGAHPGREAQP